MIASVHAVNKGECRVIPMGNGVVQGVRLSSCALVCAVLLPLTAFAGVLWEDGNFIAPLPTPGVFILADTGERVGSWRVAGQPGNVAFTSGAYVHHGFSFYAQNSATKTTDVWVNLAGISQSATGIVHQPVPTYVGASYTLTFYVGNIYDPTGVYGTSSTVAVYENSTLLGKYTNSDGQGTTAENWQQFSITFAADAPYTSIAFINADPPGDLNCGLDNVVFAPATDARHGSAK